MSKTSLDAMEELHTLVATILCNGLKEDVVESKTIDQAIKFLKDNRIEVDLNSSGHINEIQQALIDNLPSSFDDMEESFG